VYLTRIEDGARFSVESADVVLGRCKEQDLHPCGRWGENQWLRIELFLSIE
jgi:hypothetical protein